MSLRATHAPSEHASSLTSIASKLAPTICQALLGSKTRRRFFLAITDMDRLAIHRQRGLMQGFG